MIGNIKNIVRDRGFGFIRAVSGLEYFFHRSECATFDTLVERQKVEFEPVEHSKGPRAERIRPVT